MTDEAQNSRDPAIFHRGALKLTFDLVRPFNPSLSLAVRNQLSSTPLPKSADDVDNEHADRFKVDLDSFQVRYIVEALMQYQNPNANHDAGKVSIAKALTEDWLALAKKMIDELPDDQNPFK